MLRFAANLSMLYPDLPFLDRFAAAAKDGFEAVEYLFPYAFDAREIAARLADNGLQQILFNAPPGDWAAGERGLACLSGREAEFLAGIDQALAYAHELNCGRVHVMAGVVPEYGDRESLHATYEANLRRAVDRMAREGVDLLIEPINTRDMPGYFLNRQDEAHRIVSDIGAANLKVQMDLYHCQIVEGDVATKLRRYLAAGRLGHIQIAGVPERHEPDTGELNYEYIFGIISESGYSGWIGCEYRPRGDTSAGLEWLRLLRRRAQDRPPAKPG